MNIIYDICDDILLETSLIDILTKYDDFNIKMLNFIKSKNKLYFELLDNNHYINFELHKDHHFIKQITSFKKIKYYKN